MNILLIGCGHMGSAMLKGWTDNTAVTHIDIVDPHAFGTNAKAAFYKSLDDVSGIDDHDMIVLAVKPQIMDAVCGALAARSPAVPVLSIAAGWGSEKIAAFFKTPPVIIRTMPNMPAAIGQGMLVSFTGSDARKEHKAMAEKLLSPLGKHIWIDDENLMHAVTALSGSGPAYIFALTKVMEEAGRAIGLPGDIATILARRTVTGSAAYMALSDEPAQNLIDSIAVAGGTTEAAINILKDQGNPGNLAELFTKALTAARERSRELGR